MQKAREEVLSVLGHGAMRSDMVSKLNYLSAVIRETLRLYPTAPGFTLMPTSQDPCDFPMYLGKEQYIVRQGESISVSVPTLHRDPAVYGDDANEFRPERMVDKEFNKLPKNSFKVNNIFPTYMYDVADIGRSHSETERAVASAEPSHCKSPSS